MSLSNPQRMTFNATSFVVATFCRYNFKHVGYIGYQRKFTMYFGQFVHKLSGISRALYRRYLEAIPTLVWTHRKQKTLNNFRNHKTEVKLGHLSKYCFLVSFPLFCYSPVLLITYSLLKLSTFLFVRIIFRTS